jgi:hypothetical protein
VVRNIPEYGMGIQILSTTNDDYLRSGFPDNPAFLIKRII